MIQGKGSIYQKDQLFIEDVDYKINKIIHPNGFDNIEGIITLPDNLPTNVRNNFIYERNLTLYLDDGRKWDFTIKDPIDTRTYKVVNRGQQGLIQRDT